MNRIFKIIVFSIILACLGCDVPSNNAIIDSQIPPTIIEASIAPSFVDFGKVTSTGTTVDITIIGYVNTSDDNGLDDISVVRYTVYSPDGGITMEGSLQDNGIFPDAVPGDGKFNSNIDLKLQKSIIGTYSVQFSTVDRQGFTSNTFNLPLKITLSTNSAPFVSNLLAPDTVLVPNSADSVNFVFITIDVADPDGLSDVTAVVLTSQRPDSTVAGTFSMYDDGNTIVHPQFQLTSGDLTANDGKYSVTIPIFSSTQRNTYRDFIFTARDQSDTFSNSIIKRVYIE